MNLQQNYTYTDTSGTEKTSSLFELFIGKKTILFFYPKDNTPGCTVENIDFTNLKSQFEEQGYQVIGISKDSLSSHCTFIEKHKLENILISDPDLVLHKELGAYGEKNNYGKIVQGVIRSTFIIDENGKVIKEFRNIRAKGHAERMLKEVGSNS